MLLMLEYLAMAASVLATIKTIVVAVVVYVLGGCALGILWDRCTRPPGLLSARFEIPVGSLRRDSWYGRLYARAYGYDRRWITWKGTLTRRELPAWNPPVTGGYHGEVLVLNPEFVMYECEYDARCERAREMARALRLAPPFEQMFFANGRPNSICPMFHKIMIAAWIYAPLVVFRAWLLAQIVRAVCAAATAVATAYRWVGERFGQPIRTGISTTVVGSLLIANAYAYRWIDERGTVAMAEEAQDSARQRMFNRLDALTRAEREEQERMDAIAAAIESARLAGLRAPFVERFTAECIAHLDANPPRAEACYHGDRTADESHEELATRCAAAVMPYTTYLATLHDSRDRRCWTRMLEPFDPRWRYDESIWQQVPRRATRVELRRYQQEYAEYERYYEAVPRESALIVDLVQRLRVHYAAQLSREEVLRAERVAAGKARDEEMLAAARTEFDALHDDPIRLAALFEKRCDSSFSRRDVGWTSTLCAELGMIYMEDISDGYAMAARARSSERLWKYVTSAAEAGGKMFLVLAALLIACLAFGAMLMVLHRLLMRPLLAAIGRRLSLLGRAFAWIGRGLGRFVWGPIVVGFAFAGGVIIALWTLPQFVAFRAWARVALSDAWTFVGAFVRAQKDGFCPITPWK